MRHLVSGRKLNRTASHRRAMFSNMAVSLLDKERITTTLIKAKELRPVVERLITYGKKGDLHSIRLAARRINDKTVLKKLFDEIAPSFKDREGGYTRIVKVGERKGDNALMSIIELVGRGGIDTARRRKKGKKATTNPIVENAGITSDVQETAESKTDEAPKKVSKTKKNEAKE